jgi:hypothetical protein
MGLCAERLAGIVRYPFGERQHMLQGDYIDGWSGGPDVVGHGLQPLLHWHPRALGPNAQAIELGYGGRHVAGVAGKGEQGRLDMAEGGTELLLARYS